MSLLPLPEAFPAGYIAQTEHFYTANQMIAYGKQCRQQALQEAAARLRAGLGHNSSAEGIVRRMMGEIINNYPEKDICFAPYDAKDDLK